MLFWYDQIIIKIAKIRVSILLLININLNHIVLSGIEENLSGTSRVIPKDPNDDPIDPWVVPNDE